MSVVAVVGASRKPERYSNRTLQMLASHGHSPVPVSKTGHAILGYTGYASLTAVPGPIDTVTVYLSPEKRILSSSFLVICFTIACTPFF